MYTDRISRWNHPWVIFVWDVFGGPSDQTAIESNGKYLMDRTIMVRRDKVQMYEEIMTNDENLESNLPTSSLLKKTSGLHAGTS